MKSIKMLILLSILFFQHVYALGPSISGLGAQAQWSFILDSSLWEYGAEIKAPQFYGGIDDHKYTQHIKCTAISSKNYTNTPVYIYGQDRGTYLCTQTAYADIPEKATVYLKASITILAAGQTISFQPTYLFDPWGNRKTTYGANILLYLDKEGKLNYRSV